MAGFGGQGSQPSTVPALDDLKKQLAYRLKAGIHRRVFLKTGFFFILAGCKSSL